jgi:rhodanese-related sulfurtransferase
LTVSELRRLPPPAPVPAGSGGPSPGGAGVTASTPRMQPVVVLFTRDLRLHDNPVLDLACCWAAEAIPVFVFDLTLPLAAPNRAGFLFDCLTDLRAGLRQRGGDLLIRQGDPVAEVISLARSHHAQGIILAADVSRYAGCATGRGTPMTVDELLAEARAVLPHRPSPAGALHAQARGALLVDIREDNQRRADGLIPGAIVLPRNCLEWRCDPASQWRHPAITRRDLRIILICHQGYQSSLAAVTLQQLGLIHATDLDGGFTAWAAAGLPVIAPPTGGRDPSGNRHPDRSPR